MQRGDGGKAAAVWFGHAGCVGMVGVAALVVAGVHGDGCYYVGWIIRFLRTRRESGSSVVAQTELSRLFVMWDDAKFLRHVRWEVAASRGMESRRPCTLCVFLALAIGKFGLRECCRAQIRAAKTGCE